MSRIPIGIDPTVKELHTSGSYVRSRPVKILDFVLAFEDKLHLNK